MRRLVALLVVMVPALAHADRSTVLNVGMTFGASGDPQSANDPNQATSGNPFSLVGPRATLAWENNLLELPEAPGYRFAGALVPEIVVGSYIQSDRAEGYIGVGLRADLQMAQREQGLLRVSARGAIYLVGRALVMGPHQEPMYEFGFGEYLARFHTRTRVGFELTVVERPDIVSDNPNANLGGFVGFYVGG